MLKKLYYLSNPQKTIWSTEEIYKGSPIENISATTIINEKIDFDKFQKAINLFVKRNDSFRLKFVLDNGIVKQFVEDYEEFPIESILVGSDKDVEQLENVLSATPFNVLNSFLFIFKIFKFPDGHGGFVVNMHHLISDAWTSGLGVSQIIDIYTSLLHSESFSDEKAPSYIDYLTAEQEYINSEKYIKDKRFWNEIFETVPDVATLPGSNSSESNLLSDAKRKQFIMPLEMMQKVDIFCKENKVSPFNFFMAIFSLYVSKISSLDDFVIGTPVLNRANFKEKQTTGMFISVVPFRVSINHEDTFSSLCSKIASDFAQIYRHQKYSYQTLLEDLRKKNGNIPNLFNIMLSYQNMRTNKQTADINYESNWIFNNHISNDIDIHFFDINDTGNIAIAYDYRISKYSTDDIISLHHRLLNIVNQILTNKTICVKDIEVITPDEKNQILRNFNNTKMGYPNNKTIVELFEEQVEKTPDNIALVFESQTLTYRELNEKANSLAEYLINNGVCPNDIIAILLDKSIEIVVTMLGILKAHCAFLPLDIDYPIDRINYMLTNSNAKFICSSNKFENILSAFKNKFIDVTLSNNSIYSLNGFVNQTISPDDLMYVIYTSGSTGKPKGVMVTHKNIVRLVTNQNFIKYSPNEVMVQTGTIAFDACILEIFAPLLHGFKLFILRKEILLNLDLFEDFLIKNEISILFLTTGLFNEIGNIRPTIFRKLKYLLTGGDIISPMSVDNILKANPNINLVNCYGPTENGSYSTCFNIPNNWDTSYIPIGKPISNSTAYIVSKDGNLLPFGCKGELWVGGDGISKGYIGLNDLTREKFVKSPFVKNELIYKTGDLVKYDNLGNICFLGRIDNQVKIRGYRIELGEIDSVILKLNNIVKSLSVVKNVNGSSQICSYIIANESINVPDFKKCLSNDLPKYMIPSAIMQLEKFPLTQSGKIDVKKLPDPQILNVKSEIILPRNVIDSKLIELLKPLLKIDAISIDDNFFEIGGDSLSAINLCAQIQNEFHVQLFVKDLLESPIIQEISDIIQSNLHTTNQSIITPVSKMDSYPLSSAQKRIFFASNMSGADSIIYNVPGSIILDGKIDIGKLENCFNDLIQRHESLRTYFEFEDGNVVQKIKENVDFKLDKESNCDYSSLDKIFENFIQPFDLSKGPLFRAKIISFKNKKSALFVDMHHIIADGTSLTIFIDELCKLYNNESLHELNITYKDFAMFEQNKLDSDELKEAEDYWINQFSDEVPVLNLPTNYARPSVQSFEGAKVYSTIDAETTAKINKIAKLLSVTPYMILLSAYYILLEKYTSQYDIVVGSPIVGRDISELYNVIGMFVNTLALRTKIDSNQTFKDFLKVVKNNCLNAYKYQTYPFDELVNKLTLQRDVSRSPLFDTLFIFQNNGLKNVNFNNIKSEYYIPDAHIAKFDLSLELIPTDNNINFSFEYCTKLFEKSFIEKLSNHYLNILNAVLDNLDIKISDINMLSNIELNKILFDFNATNLDYPKNLTIVQLFEEQVTYNPDNIAVVFDNEKLTYRELNAKANSLAHHLKQLKVDSNDIIPVLMNRSIDLIISMLAIIKSGAAYLPVSTEMPAERINYIFQNSNAKFILTKASQNLISNTTASIVDIEQFDFGKYNTKNLDICIKPSDLLYVIYTSGSTGNPKGVKLCHHNLVNFIQSFNNIYGDISSTDKLLASTNISFDVSIFEFFITLLNGATLYLYDEPNISDIFKYCKTIMKNKITFLYIPPNILEEVYSILSSNTNIPINKILLGVEPIKSNTVNKYYTLNPNLKIVNAYGPTETTICATAVSISNNLLNKYKIIPIGKPLSNLNIFILDKDLQPVPINVPGEIYISGDNVSKGYLNNKELTDKSFVTLSHLSCKNAYRTGDLAKWNDDGLISFIGRSDYQIKINGHRIEIGEIESCLYLYPNIDKAVVLVDKNNKLICYFSSSKQINIADLKAFLQRKLPLYFIPNFFIQIDSFKLTSNGKIDRKALQKIKIDTQVLYEPPQTEYQKNLVEIFENVLGMEHIGITDNFFEIGGDSLLAIKLQIEAFNKGIDLSYKDIFNYPTIKQLSENISSFTTYVNDFNDDYDYTNISKLLSNNTVNHKSKFSKNKFKNILLTGATGYIGSHILDYILKNTKCNVYCLIRLKDNNDPQVRLLNTLRFYFGNKYDKAIFERIIVIEGDIKESNLGLNDLYYEELGNSMDCVINCAAIVKHYGNIDTFNSTNIQGAKNIIHFCSNFNCQLFHLSTLSVSGNIFETDSYKVANLNSDIIFNEQSLYINQDLSNVYIYTKFIAERLVLENIISGNLNGKIIRLGNITNRYSDGIFQINVSENAFLNRINSFLQIGCIPDYLADKYIEFSPVDLCAEAIVKLIFSKNNFSIYHVYNNNHISFRELIYILNTLKVPMQIVDKSTFNKKIHALSKDNQSKSMLSGIINDFDENKNLSYNTNIKIQNNFTNKLLKNLSFKWPKINEKYIKKYIIYLKSIGYIK